MQYRRAIVTGGTFFFTLETSGSMPIWRHRTWARSTRRYRVTLR